jgi:hypothetical protein
MGSVDRSANKSGLHNIPSGLMTDSTGRPRAAVDAGEMKGGKCPNGKIVGHGPPAHRNGKPERRATGDDSAWNVEHSAGHDQLAARSERQAVEPGQDRSTSARRRKGNEG